MAAASQFLICDRLKGARCGRMASASQIHIILGVPMTACAACGQAHWTIHHGCADRVNRFFWSIEQREVDRVAHLAVPAVARVQPIAAIVDRPHLCGDLGVAKRSIEVGDAIESAGLADPFVDGNAVLLARSTRRP